MGNNHGMDPEDEQLLLNFGPVVDDPAFLSEMQGRLHQMLRSTGSPTIFPGGQPVSFTTTHLREVLPYEDYYVCEKSDGIRYLLYFCSPPGGPAAFLIDRNYRVMDLGALELPRKDGSGIHDDTLLDGELLIDIYPDGKKQVMFMIFDILMVNGHNLMGLSLPDRLKHVQNDVIAPFERLLKTANGENPFPFKLQLKTMYKTYHMGHLFSDVIPALHHGNDGLIFTPVEDPYVSGTCPRMLKWKPAELNSVDFRLDAHEPADDNDAARYEISVAEGGQHRFYALFRTEPDLEEAWAADPPLGKIIECRYDPDWIVDPSKPDSKGGWRFLRFRVDKVSANAKHVVQKIISSISDNVKKEQLIAACADIKRKWDLRHPPDPKRPKQ